MKYGSRLAAKLARPFGGLPPSIVSCRCWLPHELGRSISVLQAPMVDSGCGKIRERESR